MGFPFLFLCEIFPLKGRITKGRKIPPKSQLILEEEENTIKGCKSHGLENLWATIMPLISQS